MPEDKVPPKTDSRMSKNAEFKTAFPSTDDVNAPVNPISFEHPVTVTNSTNPAFELANPTATSTTEQTARAFETLANHPNIQVQSEAIRAGIGQGTPVVTNMADTDHPPKPETPEEAQEQKEAAWSSVMDEMEQNREQSGFYFAKFGSKLGVVDMRVLIIKAPVNIAPDPTGWIIITRDDAKIFKPRDNEQRPEFEHHVNNRIEQETRSFVKGEDFQGDPFEGYLDRINLGSESINNMLIGRTGNITDVDVIKRAIDLSKPALRPFSRAELDQRQIARANNSVKLAYDLRSVINPSPKA